MRNPHNIPLSEWLTLRTDEVSALLGLGRSSIYKAISAGDLVPCKCGKRTIITQNAAVREEHAGEP